MKTTITSRQGTFCRLQKFHVPLFSQYPSLLVPGGYWRDFCNYRLGSTFLEVHINVTIRYIFFSVQLLWLRIMLRPTQVCIIVFLLLSSIPWCVYTTICVYIHLLKLILWGEAIYWEGGMRSAKMCHILIMYSSYVFVKVYWTIHLRSLCCRM